MFMFMFMLIQYFMFTLDNIFVNIHILVLKMIYCLQAVVGLFTVILGLKGEN